MGMMMRLFLLSALISAPLGLPVLADTASPIARFVENAIGALGLDGRMDMARFACATEPSASDNILSQCKDTGTGIRFLHIASGMGDDVSVSIILQSGTAGGADLAVQDRTGFEAQKAAFKALLTDGPLAAMPRCKIEGNPKSTAVLFAVKNPATRTPIGFLFAGPDDQAIAVLDAPDPSADGTIVGTILIMNRLNLSCDPVE
jgi:hypothetical protein